MADGDEVDRGDAETRLSIKRADLMTTHAVLYYTHFVSDTVRAELTRLRRELRSDFELFAMGCCPESTTLSEAREDECSGQVI